MVYSQFKTLVNCTQSQQIHLSCSSTKFILPTLQEKLKTKIWTLFWKPGFSFSANISFLCSQIFCDTSEGKGSLWANQFTLPDHPQPHRPGFLCLFKNFPFSRWGFRSCSGGCRGRCTVLSTRWFFVIEKMWCFFIGKKQVMFFFKEKKVMWTMEEIIHMTWTRTGS